MKIYVCELCGYEYNPQNGDDVHGIEQDTYFEDLPDEWVCPICGASKDDFEAVEVEEE